MVQLVDDVAGVHALLGEADLHRAAVDLGAGGYKLQLYSNGSAGVSATTPLTGIVASGDVFVVCHSSASSTITGLADQVFGSGSALTYNGDDAVVLVKGAGNSTVDAFGQTGFDPGTEWGTGVTTTPDNTLVRMSTICAGDIVANNAFDPSIEWDGFVVDTFSNLGSHTADCGSGRGSSSVTPFAISRQLVQVPQSSSISSPK